MSLSSAIDCSCALCKWMFIISFLFLVFYFKYSPGNRFFTYFWNLHSNASSLASVIKLLTLTYPHTRTQISLRILEGSLVCVARKINVSFIFLFNLFSPHCKFIDIITFVLNPLSNPLMTEKDKYVTLDSHTTCSPMENKQANLKCCYFNKIIKTY